MSIATIFGVFSRRPAAAGYDHDIPESTRTRVFLLFKRILSQIVYEEFWSEVHRTILMRHGKVHLAPPGRDSHYTDAITFLLKERGEYFLDFLEDIFRIETLHRSISHEGTLIADLNELLRVDDLPYYLTDFVTETTEETSGKRRFSHFRVLSFPTVIMRDSEVLHQEAIVPSLQLLQNPMFATANTEFIAALEDYRRSDYGDTLTKCGSAFESFMKIICAHKKWSFKETDTASALIKTILQMTSLDSFFETTLMIVATLRNRLSSAHGAGTTKKEIPPHLAQYAINTTAGAMVLLARECGVA